MVKFFKRIRNWIKFGTFKNIYIITYNCSNNDEIKTYTIGAESLIEALDTISLKFEKGKCEELNLIDYYEY